VKIRDAMRQAFATKDKDLVRKITEQLSDKGLDREARGQAWRRACPEASLEDLISLIREEEMKEELFGSFRSLFGSLRNL